LFEDPVPATQANIERAQAFLESRQGGGGTEMMKAIKAALDPSDSNEHLRIVCFMTDAFVGNDDEIIAEIQRHPKARVFSFGIGSSVNRSLLDRMAEAGNGEVEYVSLKDDGSKAAKRFYERVRTPLLTDLSIEWNGIPVSDVYPSKIGDLFSAKPVVVNGRYAKAANGNIKLKGLVAGQPYERIIAVNFPEAELANDVLATLWARERVDELTSNALRSKTPGNVNAEITKLGLEFGILTNFTSFVAVQDKVVNQNGKPVTIQVPVAIPEGVDRKMTVGIRSETVLITSGGGGGGVANTTSASVSSLPVARRAANKRSAAKGWGSGVGDGSGSGSGSGRGTGTGSGYGSGGASAPPPPSATPVARLNSPALVLQPPQTAGTAILEKRPVPPTPEMLREQKLKEKLHSWIYALITRVRLSTNDLTPNEAKFVREGKASIHVVLTAKSAEAIEKLKALGLEVELTMEGMNIYGRITTDKLAALAELDAVRFVLPNVR
jgi:hypothetical protein